MVRVTICVDLVFFETKLVAEDKVSRREIFGNLGRKRKLHIIVQSLQKCRGLTPTDNFQGGASVLLCLLLQYALQNHLRDVVNCLLPLFGGEAFVAIQYFDLVVVIGVILSRGPDHIEQTLRVDRAN